MFFSSSSKWQEGSAWDRYFQLYDEVATDQFQNISYYESKLVPTSFGDIQVHLCGDPTYPPIVLFHGIGSCSLMFGDWILSELSRKYYCIALDTIGDLGKSKPKDGDLSNGPKTEEEMADWAVQVIDAVLRTDTQVNLVGYSMGSFIASCVARYRPHRVKKVILTCPAGTVAPIRLPWLLKAIWTGILSTLAPSMGDYLRLSFVKYMMVDPDNNMKHLKRIEFLQAAGDLGMSKVNIQPRQLELEQLQKMNEACPTLLIIGQQETVIDADAAINMAEKAGLGVKVYENAGHMMYCEPPARDTVARDIDKFMTTCRTE
ncbi:MAG: hypothetical protein SGILL_001783 [Bacillariaceae sp.]